MLPAFTNPRHAALFGALLLFFLTLPLSLRFVGPVSLEQAYAGISERAGSYDYIRRQVFDERSEVDILFCGSSLLGNGIDPRKVSEELSRALSRQANVVLIPQSWQGPDVNYFVARDFMERRKVKLLVIAAPAPFQKSGRPHVQAFRVVRYGDHPGALDGLAYSSRLAFYAAFVLGGPRQALSWLRPNEVDSSAGRDIGHGTFRGYAGAPFVARPTEPPQLNPEAAIWTPENGAFRFEGPPLNDYQSHFLKKSAELARLHGAMLVILHLPTPSERLERLVSERRGLPEVIGPGVALAGIPTGTLFRDIPAGQFLDYFLDDHLNANGMALFTKAISPTLVRLYELSSQCH